MPEFQGANVYSLPRLSLEASRRAADQIWAIFAVPEVERRVAAGRLAPDAPAYTSWQVLLHPGGDATVRLGDEVRAVFLAHTASPVVSDEIPSEEVVWVDDLRLPDDDDGDAGHFTVLAVGKGQAIAFDFRYYGDVVAQLLTRAGEFLETATDALAASRLNAFVDNAYSAVELTAKAELALGPSVETAKHRSHGAVQAPYNLLSRSGLTDPAMAAIFNRLGALRPKARYAEGSVSLTTEEARAILEALQRSWTRVQAVAPRRPALGAASAPIVGAEA